MNERKWFNPHLPQTLQIAIMLLYLNAVFAVLYGGLGSPIGILLIAGGVGAGFGIANEKKWGYFAGIAMAVSPFVLRAALDGLAYAFRVSPITLMFEVALVALLLHPQSRDYQDTWFK
mgnify:FL=1|jgi:uncharacterized membrane protein